MLCAVRYRSLRRTDYLSRGELPSVVRLSVIEEPDRGGLDPLGLSSHERKHGNHVREIRNYQECERSEIVLDSYF